MRVSGTARTPLGGALSPTTHNADGVLDDPYSGRRGRRPSRIVLDDPYSGRRGRRPSRAVMSSDRGGTGHTVR